MARPGRERQGLPTAYAERVLGLVEQIPRGAVLTYGDIAAMVGVGGPRQVGTVLATWGDGVPWWRVVRADGTLVPALADRAAARLLADGTPLRDRPAGGVVVDLARARWTGPAR